MKPTTETRFWDKVHCEPNTGCWLWAGCMGGNGYGQFHDGKKVFAHRFSYELHVGPIPAGLFVLHKCDVRVCVNPGHLHTGTHADNMRDAHERGRFAAGERNGRTKLTEQDVVDIRTSDMPRSMLAKKYGVSRVQIYRILRRVHWGHV